MSILEMLLLGVGLAMDAFAVSITDVLGYKNLTKTNKISIPVAFGLFQGLMPMLGYFAGNLFADFISKYAGIVTLLVLGYIGGNMIYESYKESKENGESNDEVNEDTFGFKVLIMQAIATSIDAFAVGVSLAALKTNVFLACSIIAVTTCALCFVALYVGKKFGEVLGERAQILGGLILIIIGIKALF
ncbi:MAG: manganese efflux pump [Erysipelotrichales bacterium]|nr:manganese efflux pump [Erysipelotrichales bacterium]